MRGVWGAGHEHEHEHEQELAGKRGSENEGYDPLRSYSSEDRKEMVEGGIEIDNEERGGRRESSIDIDQQELYDPLNPMMDQGEHTSRPYDVERYRRVSLGVVSGEGNEKEDEISWGEGDEGADEVEKVTAQSGERSQPMEIDEDGSEHGHGTMDVEERDHVSGAVSGSHETQVEHQTEQDQDKVEGSELSSQKPLTEVLTEDGNHAQSKEDKTFNEKETESLGHRESGFRSQGNEKDEESGDQGQQPHVSYVLVVETEEDPGKVSETVQEKLDIVEEYKAEGDAASRDQEMEIDFESEGQDQKSDVSGGDKDEDKDHSADTAGDETSAKDKVESGSEAEAQVRSNEMEIDYESEDQDQGPNVSSDEQGEDEVPGVDSSENQNDVQDEVGSVIDIQNEAEPEADLELPAQEMEIDYESEEHEEHSIISSDRGEVGCEAAAETESPVDYQSNGEDEGFKIFKPTEQQKPLLQEEHESTASPQDTSPTNPTSEQLWSQLEILDRERTTSLSSNASRHLDSFSQRHQSVVSHASHAAEHLKTGEKEPIFHSQAQEEHLERLSSQAYSPAPFRRSPAPELPSPIIDTDGFLLPSPPIRSSNPFLVLDCSVVEPRVSPDNALDSMNQMIPQANDHAEQVFQLLQPQSLGLDSITQHFSHMNEVLGPISDLAARMQAAQHNINARAAIVAQHVEGIGENGLWGEMRRLREVALERLAQRDKDNGKDRGLFSQSGNWTEEWSENLRMVDGKGMVYVLKRVLVDGDGYATEDVVEVEVEAPVSKAGGEVIERGGAEGKDPKQIDDAEAEAKDPDDSEGEDELTQKMDELFGDSDNMEEDDPCFWDGSSDAMNEALDPEVREMEEEYAAMMEEYGMNDGEESQHEDEDEDEFDAEYDEEDDELLDSE